MLKPRQVGWGEAGPLLGVPALQSARDLPMQPASKRSDHESAWPFADFTGVRGAAPTGGDGGIERRSRLLAADHHNGRRAPSEAAAHERFMTGSERFALRRSSPRRPPERLRRLFDRRQLFLIPLSEARSECKRAHEQQDANQNYAKDAVIHRHHTDCFEGLGSWPRGRKRIICRLHGALTDHRRCRALRARGSPVRAGGRARCAMVATPVTMSVRS